MEDFQGTNFIDSLYFEDAETRLKESTRLIVVDRLIEPGTDEYYELARMRLQAKKEIMGLPKKNESVDTFSDERAEHDQSQWSVVMK